jgi:hypothetical protein
MKEVSTVSDPDVGWIVHHEWCEHGKIVFTGVTVEPHPACELPVGRLREFGWLFSVDPNGRLVVRARNGTHSFELIGIARDHQGYFHLRLRWVETLPADPPPVPPEAEAGLKTPWKHGPTDGERDYIRTTGDDFHDGVAPLLDGEWRIAEPTRN